MVEGTGTDPLRALDEPTHGGDDVPADGRCRPAADHEPDEQEHEERVAYIPDGLHGFRLHPLQVALGRGLDLLVEHLVYPLPEEAEEFRFLSQPVVTAS